MESQMRSLRGIWRWGRLALPMAVLAVVVLALARTGEADTTVSLELSIGIPGVCDTLSGSAKCVVAEDASFTLDIDVDSVQAVPLLAGGYGGVQMVISWEGSVEGPKPANANTLTNTSTDVNCVIRIAQLEPGARVDHASVACNQLFSPLTMGTSGFKNANLGQAEFDCVSPGVGTITLLHGAATGDSFVTDLSLQIHEEKNPSDVLTVNCGAPPPTDTPPPLPTPTSTITPTPLPTDTPTQTPTLTPTVTPGGCPDFDGDTLCDDVDDDDDNDGCLDLAELQTAPGSQMTGGGRDPLYYWDFMDMWVNKQKDRRVNIIDIGALVNRFGGAGDPGGDPLDPPQALTGYHVSADRSPPIGLNLWNAGPPDGDINIIEIGLAVVQFGHNCS